jgi:hypothetical protein
MKYKLIELACAIVSLLEIAGFVALSPAILTLLHLVEIAILAFELTSSWPSE